MASFNGSSGSVTIETVSAGGNIILLHISGWTFDWPREEQDITEFATTAGYKAKTPGLTKITGTLEGLYQDGAEDALVDTEIVADNIGLVLAADASRKYTWTNSVNLTNLSFQTEVGIPNRWTAAFTANTVPAIA